MSKLTEQEKRVKIAEACGLMRGEGGWMDGLLENGLPNYVLIPDYFRSLDAMHEARKALTAKQRATYALILNALGESAFDAEDFAEFVKDWRSGLGHTQYIELSAERTYERLIDATSEMHAEAFGLTLGLWESEP